MPTVGYVGLGFRVYCAMDAQPNYAVASIACLLTSVPQQYTSSRPRILKHCSLSSSVQVRGAMRMMSMSVMNKMPVAAEDEVSASRSHQQPQGLPHAPSCL